MITINNEPKAYTPIFLGTTQHSLRLSLQILIMVGMKLNDEIVETYNVTVSAIELGQLPNIGNEIAIDEITGSELSGFKAKLKQSDAQMQNTASTELAKLVDLKNVGRYQLLKGKNIMTQDMNTLEFDANNLKYVRQILNASQDSLAKRLKITRQTVNRFETGEQKISNKFLDKLLNMDIHARIKYSAQRGQYLALKKRSKMGTGSRLTPELKEIIETWVNVEHWTPEQIAGNVQDVDVSASVIRLWARKGLIDIRKHKYHRQNGTPKEREVAQTRRAKEREIARLREQLKNDGELVRHSIFDRSQVVESRKQFGHWEIDLVLPAKMNNQRYQDTTAIMTFTERKTRFTALVLVRSKRSSDMIEAFKLFYERYGKAVRTITADNGSEFISWDFLEYVQKDLKIKLYYATPSSPQQRGSNENRNRKLRDFYPKGTSFKDVKQRQLDEVASKMNAMPLRQALDGKRPMVVFAQEYKTMQRYRRAYEKRKQKMIEERQNGEK